MFTGRQVPLWLLYAGVSAQEIEFEIFRRERIETYTADTRFAIHLSALSPFLSPGNLD